MSETDECPICFENKPLTKTLCNHSFCMDCRQKLYTCAICRTKLDELVHELPEIIVYEYEMPLWSGMIRNLTIFDPSGEVITVGLSGNF